MRYTRALILTLKEAPAEATSVSHVFGAHRARRAGCSRCPRALTAGAELEALGVELLVDDRDERPGVKFKDAEHGSIAPLDRVAAQVLELVQQARRAPSALEAA